MNSHNLFESHETGKHQPEAINRSLEKGQEFRQLDLNVPLERPRKDIGEAPDDLEQASQISDCLSEMDMVKFENWIELSIDERQTLLQDLEYRIAEIEHREPCQLNFRVIEERKYGAFSPTTKDITINSQYVISNDFQDYKELLDTLIHEGRHAYQDYNVTTREVNGNHNIVNEWSYNFDHYIDPNWDFQGYCNQPVEVDAREFAEEVLNLYLENVA